MRFDPFRELDRFMEQSFSGSGRTPRSMPMTALRRGDVFLVDLDLPGVDRDDVELTVERNVVTVRARRAPHRAEGDEVIIDERPYGEFSRQLFLGDNLDSSQLAAELRDGVLHLSVPVSEESKPRQIQLNYSGEQGSRLETGSERSGQERSSEQRSGEPVSSASG